MNTQTPAAGPPAWAAGTDTARIEAQLAEAWAQRRTVSDQLAWLSVQAIAAHARAALPTAATVGLACAGDGTWLVPGGYYTATGEPIGSTEDGGGELAALLEELDDVIRPCCNSLDDLNRPVWEPFTSDRDPRNPAQILGNGDRRLDISGVLAVRDSEPRVTPRQLAALMRAAGVADAALADHTGLFLWPAGHLPDGTGVIAGGHQDMTAPDPDEPFPGRVNVIRYESPAQAWDGLDFNHPVDVQVAATAAAALQVVARWVRSTRQVPAAPPARRCGCPHDATVTVGAVQVSGHAAQCAGSRPRQYVWQAEGHLEVGNLATYAASYSAAHSGIGPDGDIGTELRTWGAGTYHVTVKPLDDRPGEDGCYRVLLSVPGEQVTGSAWGG